MHSSSADKLLNGLRMQTENWIYAANETDYGDTSEAVALSPNSLLLQHTVRSCFLFDLLCQSSAASVLFPELWKLTVLHCSTGSVTRPYAWAPGDECSLTDLFNKLHFHDLYKGRKWVPKLSSLMQEIGTACFVASVLGSLNSLN